MKQLAFLIVALLLGFAGSMVDPFWGVLLYYSLALLRPQHLWKWSLPAGDWHWSQLAAGIALLGVVINVGRVFGRARLNLIAGLLIVLGVLLLLSCLCAYDVQTAQDWGMQYAKVLFMGLVAGLLIQKTWHVRALAVMALVTLGYVAYEFNYAYFIKHHLDIARTGFGDLDNNGTGLFLAMGLPFAYVFGTCARRLWQRGAALLLGVLLMHAVMMSFSRGAMLASLAGLGWLLIRSRQRLQTVAIVLALAVVIPALAGREIRNRFFSTADYEADRSANSRLDSWAAAWRMVIDRPLLGHGVRNANLYSQNYGADRQGRTIHSLYLQIAADSGLPALTVYIVLMLASLHLLGKARATCLWHLDATGPPLLNDDQGDQLQQLAAICAGFQASLLIFAIGAAFLSVEGMELPWMVMVVAGVIGYVVNTYLSTLPQPVATTSIRTPPPGTKNAKTESRRPLRRSTGRSKSTPLTKGLAYR